LEYIRENTPQGAAQNSASSSKGRKEDSLTENIIE
jgi:hypothetical protein